MVYSHALHLLRISELDAEFVRNGFGTHVW